MKNKYTRLKWLAAIILAIALYFLVIPLQAAPLNTSSLSILQQEVRGVVTDQTGMPLPGVTVTIKGKNRGTVTDIDGNYSITIEPEDILIFSFVGFQAIEEAVLGRREILIRLEEDISSLGEIQINAGYYNTTRRESTGNISRVTAEEIEMQPVVNPLQALIGRMAGVEIEQSSGVPGLAASIRIRGRNSLRQSGDYPLIIVDGVPINSSPISSIGPFTSQGIDPLNTINLSNIQSIEVLKDADATSIYGSRGANGVVLLTTKKGNYNKGSLFEASIYTGFSKVSNRMELMNTSEYLSVRREAFENDGDTPTEINAPDLVLWDQTRSTDWQEEFLGGTSAFTNLNLSISGGNENTSFLLGGSYQKQGSVFPGDLGYNKATSNFSLNHRSKNRKFQVNFTANYGVDNNKLFFGTNFVTMALRLPPNAPLLYNEDGSLNWENRSFGNPLASLYKPQVILGSNLLSNMSISYILGSGISFKTNLGYSNLNSDEEVRNLLQSFNPNTWQNVILRSNHSTTKRKSWIVEPQLLYEKEFNNFNLNTLLGLTFQNDQNTFITVEGSGYSQDHLVGNLGAANNVRINTDINIAYRYASLFGRFGLNWNKKLYLNLTGRRDGSSRFGPGKQFANFGAVGGAWIFSEESFIKNGFPLLNFGKIRGSFGTTGSDQIPDYGYLDVYQATRGPGGLYPTQLSNPDYSWEINRKIEGAIELGFINNRILLDVSYYRNRSSNQLIGYPLPSITGFTSIQANLPAVIQNTGWEIELSTINLQNSDFSWSTSLNATFPKNKLIEFDDLDLTPYRQTYRVGQPLDISLLYKFEGIDPSTGLYTIADINGDGSFDFNDKVVISPMGREFYGGISNNIRIKNFNAGFLLEFVKQKSYSYLSEMATPGSLGNNSTEILNAWREEGDNPNIQRLSQSITSLFAHYDMLESDNIITDGSFLRLKSLSLSYHLPSEIIEGLGIEKLNFFLHGQNLFTLTKYLGLDPQGGSVIPPLRTITTGLQINF